MIIQRLAHELVLAGGPHEHFGRAQFAVVLEAHRVRVGARVVDHKQIARLRLIDNVVL